METWNPKIIVVGVDGSEGSIHAALATASLARATGAAVKVVTVVREPEGWWGIVGSPPPATALGNAMADAQREALDAVEAAVDWSGIDYELLEQIGEPAKSLVAYCHETDADMLVVGRRGAGLIERLITGSVASRVVQTAPCPVLLVP